MRILVLTPTFLPKVGGAEIGIHEIYRRLGERHDVLVLAPDEPDDPASTARHPADDVSYEGAPYRVRRYREWLDVHHLRGQRLTLGLLPPFAAGMAVEAHRLVSTFRPDVVNSHFAIPNGAAILAARRLGVPALLSIVGADVPTPGKPFFWRHYLTALARTCERTLFITEFCRRAAFGEERPPNTLVVPHGVDTRLFAPGPGDGALRARHAVPPDHALLFSLQRLAPGKRVDVQIRMIAELAVRGIGATLVIAGTGPCRGELERLAGELGVADRVRFEGFVREAELPSRFRDADLFVYSSAFETFGIVTVQAFACGLPVVVPDNTAQSEVVRDRVNGLLYPTGDAAALADRVALLLRDRALASRLSAAALSAARRVYDWDVVSAAYLEALNLAVWENRRRAGALPAHGSAPGRFGEPERIAGR